MKKNKLTFGLVATILAIGALTACNEVTAQEGVVLSYTDAAGNRIDYTAADLFGSYQVGTSVANTDFQKIKEVLIRKYYESGTGRSSLDSLKKKAMNDVDGYRKEAKKNAESNGTTYEAEWEKILTAQGVKNFDELYDKMLFKQEEEDFKLHGYYGSTSLVRAQMRDGKVYTLGADGSVQYDERGNAVLSDVDMFPASTDFGGASKGYIEDQMPYHITHALIAVSGASETNPTSGTINAEEAKTLGEFIVNLAKQSEHKDENSYNTTFNILAKSSADTGSGEKYGDLGIMDLSTEFVQGFKYGVYSYDAYFNTAANEYADTKNLRDNLKPSADGEYYNAQGIKVNLATAFTGDGILAQVGEIPFGAALALANEDVYSNFPNMGYRVNGGSETYFPRNIIFNKYFNTHKICVITPDSIPFNAYLQPDGHYNPNADTADAKDAVLADNTDFRTEKRVGVANEYLTADYPGFSRQVSIGGANRNVLTTEKGQVILAVRGDSKTAGIHFIVIDRSPLSGFGTKLDGGIFKEVTEAEYTANANTSNLTTLSEYYSMLNPVSDAPAEEYASEAAMIAEKQKGTKYPFYGVANANGIATQRKTTLVFNHVYSDDKNYYTDTISSIEDKVNSYNSSLREGYTFQQLFKDGSITFNENNEFGKKVAELIRSHTKIERQSAVDDATDKKDDAWTKYVEFLVQENAAREYREKGDQKLISETCAIGYRSGEAQPENKNGLWGVGGACYAK